MEMNLLESNPPEMKEGEILAPSTPRRSRLPFIICGIILLIGGFFVAAQTMPVLASVRPTTIWHKVTNLSVAPERTLAGETDDRINFLLLGVGGEGHDGANLSDTIIVASLKPSTQQIGMISIPRDLTVNLPGHGWRRINSINAFAEEKEKGSGARVSAEKIGEIFNVPIHYVFRIDFQGFSNLIDEIGGVRVYVDRSFTDQSYPTDDFKYQTVSFKQGWHTMDGEEALQYARSRHGSNGEASDFARSRRQQKIIAAVGDKLFSFDTLLRPSRIRAMQNLLNNHLATNMELWEAVRLARIASGIDTSMITMRSMDAAPGGLLVQTKIGEAFALLPAGNDWNRLSQSIQDLLPFDATKPGIKTAKDSVKPPAVLPARIEIQNGTMVAGLAAETAKKLTRLGFIVERFGNAATRNYEQTIVVDLTGGAHLEALRSLQDALGADIAATPPNGFAPAPNTSPQFLVILGKTPTVAQGASNATTP